MRGKGITFDTGFLSAGTSTREPFDPEIVRREMRIIRDDLHCNAVRVTGGDPDRLKTGATHAADAGLEVWLCPFTNGQGSARGPRYPDMPWEPKTTFTTLADCYGR